MTLATPHVIDACLYRLRCALEAIEELIRLDVERDWTETRRILVTRYLDFLELNSRVFDQELDEAYQPSEKT